MDVANNWKDYEILDMANGEKLERWGNITLIRPDPQIIWKEKTFPEILFSDFTSLSEYTETSSLI